MQMSMLYCQDPLNPCGTDQHFTREAKAARELGAKVALLDHDVLLSGDAERAVERVPRGLGAVWYRGWMIPADRYVELARALEERGAELVVTPEAYRSAHELPGWYATFRELTPASVWSSGAPEVGELVKGLSSGPAIVKDYVKSRKHEWAEACFIPELGDTDAVERVVGRFVELQGEYLAGGVVLREFETFVGEEVRVWWVDGVARLVTAHPDNPTAACPVPELGDVEVAVRRLGARFVTTDMARRDDGVWRVVEVGDGQVSDLHRDIDPAELVSLLIDV
jgi:ATP-grasp domain, R2K clade family 3